MSSPPYTPVRAGRRTAAEERATIGEQDPIVRELRAARRVRELSQTEMAKQLGLSAHTQFSLLERGHRQPHLDTLRAWAAVLGYGIALVPLEGERD